LKLFHVSHHLLHNQNTRREIVLPIANGAWTATSPRLSPPTSSSSSSDRNTRWNIMLLISQLSTGFSHNWRDSLHHLHHHRLFLLLFGEPKVGWSPIEL
jgi:hypothetical protein